MRFIRVLRAANDFSNMDDIDKEIQRLQELKKKKLEVQEKENYKKSLYLYKFSSEGEIRANFDPESAPDNLTGHYTDEDDDGNEFDVDIEIQPDDIIEVFTDRNENAEIDTKYSGLDYDEDEVFEDLKDEDENFFEYAPKNLQNSIESIELESLKLEDDKANVIYNIYCKKQLSKQELKQLEDYMSGQLSDGIGEGFEQHPYETEWETDLQEFYKDGNFIEVGEYFNFDAKYYVSLWNNKTSITGPIKQK